MVKGWILALLGLAAPALAAQAPAAAPPKVKLHLQFNGNWFVGAASGPIYLDVRSDPKAPTARIPFPSAVFAIDPKGQGNTDIWIPDEGRTYLRFYRPLGLGTILDCVINMPEDRHVAGPGQVEVFRIPEDLPVKLETFSYSSAYETWGEDGDPCWRSKTQQYFMHSGFPCGHPAALIGRAVHPPSEHLMAAPGVDLKRHPGEVAVEVFPDLWYDRSEEPLALGLFINDTDKPVELRGEEPFVQAMDKAGRWRPIEHAKWLVSDMVIPPVVFPPHSCRNFPVRRYQGPFKTKLRVVFKDPFDPSDKVMFASEPYDGSIYPSQFDPPKGP